MSDNNTSTLQSYVDTATGAVQSVVGSVLGSSGDKVRSLLEIADTFERS